MMEDSLFDDTFRNSDLPMALLTEFGNIVEMNKAMKRLVGAERDIRGQSAFDFIDLNWMSVVRRSLRPMLRGKTSMVSFEIQYKSEGNTPRWGHITISCLYKKGDCVPRYWMQLIDDHESKEAERKLVKSNKTVSAFVANYPQMVANLDNKGHFLAVNPAGEQLLGYESKDIIQRSFMDFVHPIDAQYASMQLSRALLGSPQTMEIRVRDSRGGLLYLTLTLLPSASDDEKNELTLIAQDVTLQRRLYFQLRESEENYRMLVDGSPEAILIAANDQWIYVNQEAVKLLGAESRDQIIDKSVLSFVAPTSRQAYIEQISDVKTSAPSEGVEHQWIRLDGEWINIEVKVMSILFQGKQAMYMLIKDITQLKISQEYLYQSGKLSVAGELAAGIAHEIRNPLTSLKGFIQLMLTTKEEKWKEGYFHIMLSEVDRINQIVTELLHITKPGSSDMKVHDANELLDHVLTLLSPQAALLGIVMKTSFSKNPLRIHCDETKLKQVFLNILKNALEAMETVGGTIRTSVGTNSDGTELCVTIEDEGGGMPEEVVRKVGTPFYTTKTNGTGLGMMVCHNIMKNHKGSLLIRSHSGVGTTVTIVMPLAGEKV